MNAASGDRDAGRRPSVALRWGLRVRTSFVGIPSPLLELCRAKLLSGSCFYVLVALVATWWRESGTMLSISLNQIAAMVPVSRSRIGEILHDLNGRGLLVVYFQAGKTLRIDLRPLVDAVQQLSGTADGAVRPAGRSVSGESDAPSDSPDSDVRPAGRNCPVVEPAHGAVDGRETTRPRKSDGGGSPISLPTRTNGNGHRQLPAADKAVLTILDKRIGEADGYRGADFTRIRAAKRAVDAGTADLTDVQLTIDAMTSRYHEAVLDVRRSFVMADNTRKNAGVGANPRGAAPSAGNRARGPERA